MSNEKLGAEQGRTVIEMLRREGDNSVYASRCRSCGVTWKVYQKFPGHNPNCEAKETYRWTCPTCCTEFFNKPKECPYCAEREPK